MVYVFSPWYLWQTFEKLIGKGRWVLAHSTFSSLFANMKNKQQKPFIVYKQWLFPRTCHSSEIAFYSKRQRCILKDEVQLAGYDLYFVWLYFGGSLCLYLFLAKTVDVFPYQTANLIYWHLLGYSKFQIWEILEENFLFNSLTSQKQTVLLTLLLSGWGFRESM